MNNDAYSIKPILLLKYSKEDYLNQFLDGKLYFNTYKAIAKMDDNIDRGDHYELVHEQVKSDKIVIPLTGNNITCRAIKHPNGQYTLQYINDDFFANMFCLYAIEDNDDVEILQYKLSADMQLGTHMVAIRNIGEFFRRVEGKLRELKLDYKINPIKYIDINELNGKKSYFEKPIKFSYQKELRIAFKSDKDEACFIDVGSIRDIATMLPVGVKSIKIHKNRKTMIAEIDKKRDNLVVQYSMKIINKQILIDNNCEDVDLLKNSDEEILKAKDELMGFLNSLQYED